MTKEFKEAISTELEAKELVRTEYAHNTQYSRDSMLSILNKIKS